MFIHPNFVLDDIPNWLGGFLLGCHYTARGRIASKSLCDFTTYGLLREGNRNKDMKKNRLLILAQDSTLYGELIKRLDLTDLELIACESIEEAKKRVEHHIFSTSLI